MNAFILRWRLILNQRRFQNPVEYLRWSFFAKIFKDWLIITLPWRKIPAQVLLSQHLLFQSQEWKAQKNYESWRLSGVFMFNFEQNIEHCSLNFEHCSDVCIVDFEQVSSGWVKPKRSFIVMFETRFWICFCWIM